MKLKDRGLTLVELLITMGLMSLLATAALSLLTYSKKQIDRTQGRSDRNRQLNRLYLDLSERFFHTSSAYLQLIDSNKALALATARDANGAFRTDDQGYPLWSAWELIGLRQDKLSLWRVDQAGVFSDSVAPKAIPTTSSSRLLMSHVATFKPEIATDKTVTFNITWDNEDQKIPTVWTLRAGQGGRL